MAAAGGLIRSNPFAAQVTGLGSTPAVMWQLLEWLRSDAK